MRGSNASTRFLDRCKHRAFLLSSLTQQFHFSVDDDALESLASGRVFNEWPSAMTPNAPDPATRNKRLSLCEFVSPPKGDL